MKLNLVLLVTVACFWCCEAQSGADYYCGRQLAVKMGNVCNDHMEGKRDAGWWMSTNAVRSLTGFRGKRGISDECCFKPCTLDELLTYCYVYQQY
uniref:SFRICE_013371 n=1 Tax=Spodoptera frugiperda TaxID=7108 RepID=A0A2H1WZT3_SPOFR